MFARTGAVAAGNVVSSVKATAENSWNPNEIIKESLAARSKEKQTAMDAERYVRESKLQSEIDKEFAKRDIAINKAKIDIERTNRKAGMVAAAGKLAALNFAPTADPYRPRERDFSGLERGVEDAKERVTRANEALAEHNAQYPSSPNLTGGDRLQISDASTTPVSTSGGKVSQQSVYEGLKSRGLSDQDARIGAAVMQGESGGRAGIDTVQSGLDPNKSNEFSVGLMQINTKAHMDKLTRRGMTVDDLRDPEKNLDIAVEVFREAGNSWSPWGAFTNNSYTNYLNF